MAKMRVKPFLPGHDDRNRFPRVKLEEKVGDELEGKHTFGAGPPIGSESWKPKSGWESVAKGVSAECSGFCTNPGFGVESVTDRDKDTEE